MKKKYPALEQVLRNKHNIYNESASYCENLEADNKAVILRPEYTLNSMKKSVENLKYNYNHCYKMAYENLERIKGLLLPLNNN